MLIAMRKMQKKKDRNIYTPIAITFIIVIWFIAAHIINQPFIFPSIESVLGAVVDALRDLYVLRNIGVC